MNFKNNTAFRIVCDHNGEYRVEVLDKAIGWWYITISGAEDGIIEIIEK